MKNRIIIDFNIDDDLSGDNICMLNDELKDFIENHELTYYATNISVKFQDEYCIKEEKKKLEKQIQKRPKIKKFPKINGFELRCPNDDCGAVLQSDSPCCRYCGQALDWSDVE